MSIKYKKPVASEDLGFDAGEVNAGEVGVFLGLIMAILVGVFLFVTFFYDRFYNMLYKERVEQAPTAQLDEIHVREKAALGSYTVFDAAKGQYRVPIDKAKQLLLSEAAAGKTFYSTRDQPVKVEPGADPAAAPAVNAAAAPVAASNK